MDKLRLDNVQKHVKECIKPYLEKMVSIYGDNVISIVLYGSATGRYFIPKKSNINLAIVFKELNFRMLRQSLKLVKEGLRCNIPAPLFLSLRHIETSKDTFPIEFLEIKDNNILLYGEDLFNDIKILDVHLRLLCEREVKGKLILLREAYLQRGLNKIRVKLLMHESLSAFLPLFRAILRIKGIVPGIDKESIIIDLCNHYGLSKDIFIAILRDKSREKIIASKDIETVFEKYILEIEKLAGIVDGL